MTDHKELIRKLREAEFVATQNTPLGGLTVDYGLAAEAADFIQSLLQVATEAQMKLSALRARGVG
jgi:hypothetical protein